MFHAQYTDRPWDAGERNALIACNKVGFNYEKTSFCFVIICTIFVTLFIINPSEISFEEVVATAPSKPKSVTEDAFWVGGIDGENFILISKKVNINNVFSARIYNDYTGDLEYSGTLKYSGAIEGEKLITDPTFYQGWDGERMHLANGEYVYV